MDKVDFEETKEIDRKVELIEQNTRSGFVTSARKTRNFYYNS